MPNECSLTTQRAGQRTEAGEASPAEPQTSEANRRASQAGEAASQMVLDVASIVLACHNGRHRKAGIGRYIKVGSL